MALEMPSPPPVIPEMVEETTGPRVLHISPKPYIPPVVVQDVPVSMGQSVNMTAPSTGTLLLIFLREEPRD